MEFTEFKVSRVYSISEMFLLDGNDNKWKENGDIFF